MWEGKSIDLVFKYFGYDINGNFSSDEKKAELRKSAIERMKVYGKLPDDVMSKVESYNDEEIKRELRDKEYRESQRRRRLLIIQTKANNRENKVFENDEHAMAVYKHLIDEGEIYEEELESKKEELTELNSKLEKVKTKLERLQGAKSNDPKIIEAIQKLEIKVDELESEIDEVNEYIEENDIYGVLYEETYTHYGLRAFETPYGDYAVGDSDESETAAKRAVKDLLDDTGIDGVSSWVIDNNIDEKSLKSDLYDSYIEYYRDEITYDLSDYFEDYDEDDEDTHPSEDEIEEKAEEMTNDRVSDLMGDWSELEAMGYDIKNYVDFDGVADDVVSNDGNGHSLSSYDGNENEVSINGTYYSVFRTN